MRALVLLLLVGLAHLVAYYAAVIGLLLGILACLAVWKWTRTPTGLAVGIAAMCACAVAGYLVQELLPRAVSDWDAMERRLASWAEPPVRPPTEEPRPDTWWSRL